MMKQFARVCVCALLCAVCMLCCVYGRESGRAEGEERYLSLSL